MSLISSALFAVSSRSGTSFASGMLSIWSAITLSMQELSVLLAGAVPLFSSCLSCRICLARCISVCSSDSFCRKNSNRS